ncbi:MAG TPA: PBP1A family penicillin-binding protein [Terriglobales bacterium]|nr:PBP1A family penicillin-binding protein [Terriglobales bacterium]
MAIKVKIPQPKKKGSQSSRIGLSHPFVKAGIAVFLLVSLMMFAVFAYYYVKYDRIVEARIRGPIFSTSAKIYARAPIVETGDKYSKEEIISNLRRAGYSETDSKVGTYRSLPGGVEIKPGPLSYHNADGAEIHISGGKVDRITGSNSGATLAAYELEPPLLTSLDSEERAKRQVVKYNDIPKVMVNAVTSIEDRKFFEHSGINYVRLIGAAWVDLRSGGKAQGASTITMQISRGFFLSPQKTLKRKLTEMLIAIELEQKLTKEQIFELYANQVDMGQRGSFTIHGFAEAARAYFNKDLQSISLPEAALLAGLVQRPSYLNPYRHPERALDRRNLVLEAMVDNGVLSRDEADKAKATPLKLAPPNVEASDAPYFVDLVKDTLATQYGERELNDQGVRIYTTLDPDLQRAAAEAVQIGIRKVDEQITKLRTRKVRVGKGKSAKTETVIKPGPDPQVALVALDPQTGEVLALVGGRNYGISQLNHAVAKRPTGSIFKPFVYAAAVNTALTGSATVFTPASVVDDSPTTFTYEDKTYEPRNYKEEYHGEVAAEYALAHSLNNATVKLAEMVGYDNVATLAKAAGISSVRATPAMALGAYDATPIDMAGAYTVFANSGVRVSPTLLKAVHSPQGDVLLRTSVEKTPVLDPRVAYVLTTMMAGVINTGTGFPVRQMGFNAPAAGKTGTSRDGWFAGYTSNLICIVWVGFDDYSDLRLSGASTAAPIWAEFMKRAQQLPQFRNMTDFHQPDGVIDMRIDKVTNRISTPACPEAYSVAFIAGTEPRETCEQTDKNVFQKIFGFVTGGSQPAQPSLQQQQVQTPQGSHSITYSQGQQPPVTQNTQATPPKKEEKKGFFGKIIGVFKGDGEDNQKKD